MLKPIREDQLEMILSWRNSPEVRQMMFTQHLISAEEHYNWWRNLQNDPTRICLVYYFHNIPVGLITYYNITPTKDKPFWGFFMGDRHLLNKKEVLIAWLNLGKEAVEYGFKQLFFNHLLCETLSYNEAVLKLNHLLGFRKINDYKREVSGKLVDVITMALDENKWRKSDEIK